MDILIKYIRAKHLKDFILPNLKSKTLRKIPKTPLKSKLKKHLGVGGFDWKLFIKVKYYHP